MMELFETVVPLAKARRTTRKDLPKPLDLALFARPLAAKISGASAS